MNEAPVADDAAFAIDENSAVDTVVGTVPASDPDGAAPNNQVQFAITSGNELGAFAIDAATGQITVADPSALDREARTGFNLVVTAADQRGPMLSDMAAVAITLNDLNDTEPVVDLNGADEAGADFAVAFATGGVAIGDADATVSDADAGGSGLLASATATITNLSDAGNEILSADTIGTAITTTYDTVSGVLTLSGSAAVSDYQSVSRSITYDNTASAPTAGDRIIQVVADYGVNQSAVATGTISISVGNDAPVVAAIAQTDINETTDTSPIAANIAVGFTDADLTDIGHTATGTSTGTAGVTAGLTLDAAALAALVTPGVVSKASGSTAGSVTLAFSTASTVFGYLAVGETVTLSYSVLIDDLDGGQTP